jgi:hypothetical protein
MQAGAHVYEMGEDGPAQLAELLLGKQAPTKRHFAS